ncbi:hypothetical protein KP509_1Z001100 [Ceratopteris richardii]|nr:hypothetical protein KP509_1Z001100 [Ceratopteris richardii]
MDCKHVYFLQFNSWPSCKGLDTTFLKKVGPSQCHQLLNLTRQRLHQQHKHQVEATLTNKESARRKKALPKIPSMDPKEINKQHNVKGDGKWFHMHHLAHVVNPLYV